MRTKLFYGVLCIGISPYLFAAEPSDQSSTSTLDSLEHCIQKHQGLGFHAIKRKMSEADIWFNAFEVHVEIARSLFSQILWHVYPCDHDRSDECAQTFAWFAKALDTLRKKRSMVNQVLFVRYASYQFTMLKSFIGELEEIKKNQRLIRVRTPEIAGSSPFSKSGSGTQDSTNNRSDCSQSGDDDENQVYQLLDARKFF